MLFTLEEIGIEAVMILATIATIACFVTLVVFCILERRELRRIKATAPDLRARPMPRPSCPASSTRPTTS